jgi:hypothetical protein
LQPSPDFQMHKYEQWAVGNQTCLKIYSNPKFDYTPLHRSICDGCKLFVYILSTGKLSKPCSPKTTLVWVEATHRQGQRICVRQICQPMYSLQVNAGGHDLFSLFIIVHLPIVSLHLYFTNEFAMYITSFCA